MSSAEIQQIIDGVGKHIHSGVTITFQFADGTYSLTNSLIWEGFYGGGTIIVDGNTSETSGLHTSQAVVIDGSSLSSDTLSFRNIHVHTYVRYLAAKGSDTSWHAAFSFIRCSAIEVQYSYAYSDSKTNTNIGFGANWQTLGKWHYCYVSNTHYGFNADQGSTMISENNASTGTDPTYGLRAGLAGTIGRYNTQPSGSTSDTDAHSSGEIR